MTWDVSQFFNLIEKSYGKNGKNWMQRQKWGEENINQMEFHLLIYVEKCNLNITDKWIFIIVDLHNKLESCKKVARDIFNLIFNPPFALLRLIEFNLKVHIPLWLVAIHQPHLQFLQATLIVKSTTQLCSPNKQK